MEPDAFRAGKPGVVRPVMQLGVWRSSCGTYAANPVMFSAIIMKALALLRMDSDRPALLSLHLSGKKSLRCRTMLNTIWASLN